MQMSSRTPCILFDYIVLFTSGGIEGQGSIDAPSTQNGSKIDPWFVYEKKKELLYVNYQTWLMYIYIHTR